MKTIIHLDSESTGTDISKDRIIQLSMIKTDMQFSILERKKFLLSNCGVPIHPKAFEAHGISEEQLIGKFTFSQYAPKFFEYLNSCDFLCAYNGKSFDIPLLYEEFSRAGLIWTPKPIIDPFIIFKNREHRTLAAALKFYCGKEIEGAHDAENDVLAMIEVLEGQVFMYGLDNVPNETTLEEALIYESSYPDENKRLTFDGKIILNDENVAIWNFGKNKNLPVISDLGYCQWVLSQDFPSQTKNVIKCILEK